MTGGPWIDSRNDKPTGITSRMGGLSEQWVPQDALGVGISAAGGHSQVGPLPTAQGSPPPPLTSSSGKRLKSLFSPCSVT